MLPQMVEWTLRRGEADVKCLRCRLPAGIVELSVVFCGLLVASWMTKVPEKADAWVDNARRSWEAAGWTQAAGQVVDSVAVPAGFVMS